jgi:hypothetical protein
MGPNDIANYYLIINNDIKAVYVMRALTLCEHLRYAIACV